MVKDLHTNAMMEIKFQEMVALQTARLRLILIALVRERFLLLVSISSTILRLSWSALTKSYSKTRAFLPSDSARS
jgi:hypothetical protein